MKTTFNLDSMFFRVLMLANGKSKYYYRNQDWNTCSLVQHALVSFLILGVFKLAITTIVTAFVFGFLGQIGQLICGFQNVSWEQITWWWPIVWLLIGTLTCVVSLVSVVSIAAGVVWINSRVVDFVKKERTTNNTPASVLYRSWKDKFCSKVDFE